MKKFSIKILLLVLWFMLPGVSFAQVEITEIMYSPSSKQWIEIYNNTDNEIDLTQYKILDDGASVKGHGISALVADENMVPAHSYAIIAKEPNSISADFMFKSPLNIKTTGDEIKLYLNSSEVDSVSFLDGAATDGNSLQKINSSWTAADPTPGETNSASDTSDTSNTSTSGSDNNSSSGPSSSSPSSLTRISTPGRKLEITAGEDRVATPGSPIWFQATVKKNTASNSELNFHWSFGDGEVGIGNLVSHTYKYPGNYVVVLSTNAGDFVSVSRLKVKVINPSISVLVSDSFVEITNNTDSEVNLFKWRLEDGDRRFVFQPNTIILPKSSIKIDKSLFSLKGNNNSSGVSLKDSFGQEIFSSASVYAFDEKEISENIDNLQKEVYSLVGKAVTAKLVLEKSPISKASQVASPAVASASAVATSSDSGDVIYEAPKGRGFFTELTNFVKRVFSK